MHYDINYSALPEETKSRKACVDALDYMGPKAYRALSRFMRTGKYTREQIHFAASFAGVQGYPIDAMLDRYTKE